MYKIFYGFPLKWNNQSLSKPLLIMKLAFLLVISFLIQVSASTRAQIVTLNLKNAPIKEVFVKIEKQSNYTFVYESEILTITKPISLSIKNVPFKIALDACLKDQPITYIIDDLTIIIKSKPTAILESRSNKSNDIIILGVVYDNTGLPMDGVNVKLKGTNTNVITNVYGKFAISVPDGKGELTFSYTGFITQVVNIANKVQLNITLLPAESKLDEIVIIGYGVVNRKDLTGSVGKVNIEELQKAPVKSFDDALGGRIAGVKVTSSDGQPGNNPEVIIRGGNSLTQDNSPLYVIDGFPIENPNNNVFNNFDIESVEVLKDASATAIYGARGANGVIIVTTKKGKVGQRNINYDVSYGTNERLKKQDLLEPYEFVKLQNELYPTQTATAYFINGRTLESYRKIQGIDWQDALLQNALFTNHNVSLRGGDNNTTYSTSASYINQDGIIINSGFKRYQGRLSVETKFNTKMKIGVNINYANNKTYGTRAASYGGNDKYLALMANVWGYRPVAGNDDMDLLGANLDDAVNASTDARYNPIKTVTNQLNETLDNSFISNLNFDYELTKSLLLRISGGINRLGSQSNIFNNSNTLSGDRNSARGSNGPNGTIRNILRVNYLNENTLNYTSKINGIHNINLLGGFTIQKATNSSDGFSATNIPNESLGINSLAGGTIVSGLSTNTYNTLVSFLTRLNYNYKSKYYATFTYRVDGSSKFRPENRWSYFPSGALSWRITGENFMKDVNFISDAKLRVGYGLTGNNRVTDFPYLSPVQLLPNFYSFRNFLVSASYPSALGNKNLKWETTAQSDIGIDVELFKGKIVIIADIYRKITSDLLLLAALPGSTGYTAGFSNIGKVKNEGLELTLNTSNIRNSKFSWSTSFNISFNESKVLALVDAQEAILSSVPWDGVTFGSIPAYIAKIGQPVGQIYGYVFDGLYQPTDFYQASNGVLILKPEIPNNGGSRSGILPGNAKYKDLNDNGIVDDKDQMVIGRGNPIHTGGFSNNFTFKNFDLNILFQWSYGNDLINTNRIYFESFNRIFSNQFASTANRWTQENTNTTIPRVSGVNGPSAFYSSRVVEDGSYLRLKTAQLGYNLPTKFVKKNKIGSLRFYFSAQNLITFTKYSGVDPEVSTYNSALTPGFDYSAYPRARTITLGANVKL